MDCATGPFRVSRTPARPTSTRLTLVVNAVVARIQHQRRIRETRRRLLALDDHLLADIGLIRDQVEQTARCAVAAEEPWAQRQTTRNGGVDGLAVAKLLKWNWWVRET
jgi:uncharacterized protein YjiS (DUF1127 family)